MFKLLKNKPWKEYTTRKLSFLYCLLIGTAAIVFGAIMIVLGKFDSSSWMTETLNFAKFIVGTGCTLVVAGTVENIVKYEKKISNIIEDEENGNE